MVYNLNSGQFINYLLTNYKYYVQKNGNKSLFHSGNLKVTMRYNILLQE